MRVGDTFGRYRLDAVLGEGGMGCVFAAWDQTLLRPVALKVLQLEKEEPARARLLREARAAAALEHPNAVRVYDVGEVDGVSFLAMELLQGRTLRAYVGDGSIPAVTRLRWLADVARALDAAHRRGLVHRDVKPENVHVGDDGHVRVLDFGIARSVAGDTALGSITHDGLVLGTPRYMSPEQLTGASIDGRSDQFAWGVLAFDLLTGISPWEGDDAVRVIAQIVGSPLPKHEAFARMPDGVAKVVQRATEKDPARRFASMADAGAALEAAVTGSALATTIAAPILEKTVRRAPSPPRWRARAIALALGMTGLGALVWVTSGRSPAQTRDANRVEAGAIDPAPHAPPGLTPQGLAAYASAWSAYRAGNAGLAAQRFQTAAEVDPTNAAAETRLTLLELHRDAEAARDAFRRASDQRSRLDAHDRDFLEGMRPILQEDPPNLEAGRTQFEASSAKWSNDPEMLWALSETYLAFGRFDDAERTARQSVEADRTFMQGWYDLIEAVSYLGHFDESLSLIDECTRRQPEATDCLYERYYLRSHTGRCDLLDPDARRAVLLAPEASRAQGFRAKVFLATGKSAGAMEEVISEWVARVPPGTRALVGPQARTMVAARDGDFTTAEARLADWDKAVADRTLRVDHGRVAILGAEIAEERGDLATAAKRAAAFLDRRDAWEDVAERDDSAVELDSTMELAAIARAGGAFDDARVESTRAAFLHEWDDVRFGYRPVVWMGAYAKAVRTPGAARDALAHLDTFGSLPPFTAVTAEYAFAGRALLLAGHADEAARWLGLAADSCDYMFDPIALTRAALWWGEALESKGDKKGACDAYGRVIARWGHATPRSITAEDARARSSALGCR